MFADDERSLRELIQLELPRLGHDVTVCADGGVAIGALEKNAFDCLLVDLDMPVAGGIEVITRAKALYPDIEAIVMTGKSSLETAVAALRQGAFDYLTKPCKLVELDAVLKRIADKRELTNKYRALKRRLEKLEGAPQLVGDSAPLEHVRKLIAKVAPTDSAVLILGETGTGKELVARAVHEQSARADAPFVTVNCGALPEALIESELFGHRKGAFTGADDNRVGLFEVANGGTMFLDEIGELPKATQAKLLRVLESGEIRRVGDNASFIVNFRLLCATHRQLDRMVADGDFREDLLFRINTFEIALPPLRERTPDIPQLARHLLSRLKPQLHADQPAFSPETEQLLRQHHWSGNVRELANVVEHAAILCDQLPILPEHLPANFHARRLKGPHFKTQPLQSLREIEMQAIYQSLERNSGNKVRAAEELGISLKTLYNKLNQVNQLEQSA